MKTGYMEYDTINKSLTEIETNLAIDEASTSALRKEINNRKE